MQWRTERCRKGCDPVLTLFVFAESEWQWPPEIPQTSRSVSTAPCCCTAVLQSARDSVYYFFNSLRKNSFMVTRWHCIREPMPNESFQYIVFKLEWFKHMRAADQKPNHNQTYGFRLWSRKRSLMMGEEEEHLQLKSDQNEAADPEEEEQDESAGPSHMFRSKQTLGSLMSCHSFISRWMCWSSEPEVPMPPSPAEFRGWCASCTDCTVMVKKAMSQWVQPHGNICCTSVCLCRMISKLSSEINKKEKRGGFFSKKYVHVPDLQSWTL